MHVYGVEVEVEEAGNLILLLVQVLNSLLTRGEAGVGAAH